MKRLDVNLEYRATSFAGGRGPETGLALPVKVLDTDGSVLAAGVATTGQAATLELPDTTDIAFVRLTWPSGRAQTQRVDLAERSQADLVFDDAYISRNEWSAWAIPKLNPNTPLLGAESAEDRGLDRFERVWLRLWRLSDGVWTQVQITPTASYRNGSAWQIDLQLDCACWLLQIGGSNVTWRFVSLPGGGPARVLITPRDSTDPRADELKVVVTGFRADAETLLEFLARDSIRAANALTGSPALANRLFAEKFEDPMSAVAGAYYLLRVGEWQRIPRSWFQNLSQSFRWLPDAAIVHCVRLLREGSDAQGSNLGPLELLKQSIEQGWPIYDEGVNLLREAAVSLRGVGTEATGATFELVQALGAARAWAGAAASFYGRIPSAPSALQWKGMPHAPRRKRLHPELRVSASRNKPAEAAAASAQNFRMRSEPQIVTESNQRVVPLPDGGEFLLGSIVG